MSDFFNAGPNVPSPDPDAHKAKHDADARNYHQKGITGFWRQVTDLVIAVGVLAVIAGLCVWLF